MEAVNARRKGVGCVLHAKAIGAAGVKMKPFQLT